MIKIRILVYFQILLLMLKIYLALSILIKDLNQCLEHQI